MNYQFTVTSVVQMPSGGVRITQEATAPMSKAELEQVARGMLGAQLYVDAEFVGEITGVEKVGDGMSISFYAPSVGEMAL